MRANELLRILKDVPPNAEIYILDTAREVLSLKCVEVEHPNDDESEICVNLSLQETD